ncbi:MULTISPECIES: hypothetical protein [Pseudodesulfovibrio]|uniref:Uncharacterized protein n=1 Tax=Pseudodesulfovibrio aespoeensis (strain ATCC 700646 / DSM 10631 / Aspo-2) TaxID=643562 RepID=E6VSM5_PSEA9|nr:MULTISPECIES: hypothetical protein [Pseudodesulfovibrio]ADU62010.1 hypothetical protein Daes_0994 [Pseudodesulfovibrio aespoeensis Aspo-2]MCG2732911.1 hypothetical protein [Pseudodesulfovibrio aespoeensis]
MRHITRLTLSLAVAVLIAVPALFAAPATATEFTDMDVCLGRQVLARMLCKPVEEINYVSKLREDMYLFSVFYANRETHFFVGVGNDIIRVQGKEFKTVTRTISYKFDSASRCGVVEYVAPGCPASGRIVCCAQKSAEETLEDTFWDRPIPELLEEDLRKALQGANATEPEDGGQQGQ